MDEVQFICNHFNDDHRLLSELALHLPPNGRFKLSDDFESTHLILFIKNEKITHRRAAFGLTDSCENSRHRQAVDDMIVRLLKDALENSALEETVVTLQGGDAQRALYLIQELVDNEACWAEFARNQPNNDKYKFGGVTWQRVRNLLAKLAAFRGGVPPSLRVKGLRRDQIHPYTSRYTDVYEAEAEQGKVALKRIRIFAPLVDPQKMDLLEARIYNQYQYVSTPLTRYIRCFFKRRSNGRGSAIPGSYPSWVSIKANSRVRRPRIAW
ncbi:hypothetical protein EIP86_009263 [Pleurotus ostreatoroseus]|nr:hypothetical protein EIP86_009263 [Pleurotus ostreatoroseus]